MADRRRWLLWSVRYGIPLAFFVLGLAALIFAAPIQKVEGCGSCWGAGLTVLALNVMLRWNFAEQAERHMASKPAQPAPATVPQPIRPSPMVRETREGSTK
jgi:hypothetical protein